MLFRLGQSGYFVLMNNKDFKDGYIEKRCPSYLVTRSHVGAEVIREERTEKDKALITMKVLGKGGVEKLAKTTDRSILQRQIPLDTAVATSHSLSPLLNSFTNIAREIPPQETPFQILRLSNLR